MSALKYWVWLSAARLSVKSKWKLVECFGDAQSVYQASEDAFERLPFLSPQERTALKAVPEEGALEYIASACGGDLRKAMNAVEVLFSAGVPDPELIIRPSGELRTSNFLLWQSAYSEYVFMNVLWPDFGPPDLDAAIEEYHRRNRRFGGV